MFFKRESITEYINCDMECFVYMEKSAGEEKKNFRVKILSF